MENPSKTILVVDDDPFILDLVSRFLSAKGFRVLTTTDPEKAFSLAELEMPERVAQIKSDFEARRLRDRERRVENPLRFFSKAVVSEQNAHFSALGSETPVDGGAYADIDDLYLEEEGGGACLVCHK